MLQTKRELESHRTAGIYNHFVFLGAYTDSPHPEKSQKLKKQIILVLFGSQRKRHLRDIMVTIVGSAKSAVMTGVSYPSLLHLWSGELVYYIAVPLMIIQFCPRGPCGCAIQLPTMTSSFCRVCLADLRDSLRRRRLFLSEDALRLTLF